MNFEAWVISRLVAHGAYEGSIDDVPGRQMIKGIARFQRASGLPVTERADQETVDALRMSGGGSKVLVIAPKLPAEPVWMREARRFMGLQEIAGAKSNPVIMGWAKSIGGWIASFYQNDDTPWCGLAMAHWIGSTLPREPLPANVLSALAWSKLGRTLDRPALGAILTFKRDGGGHVGLYVGEDADRFHVLGGNQKNSVSVTRIEKGRLDAIRWPATGGDAIGGRVFLKPNGAVSRNEV